jgi:hypothetical protein
MERVKPIIIKDNETGEPKYTLEFNRQAVRFAERSGFDISEVAKFPLTNIPRLFSLSFRMHHRGVTQKEAEDIYENLPNSSKSALLQRLVELYNVPLTSLVSEEEDGNDEKNARLSLEL